MKRTVSLLAAFGLAALSTASVAQPVAERPSEKITVFAPYLVQKKEQSANIHTPVLYISIQRRVSYADLDLAKPVDAAAFKSRIGEAANAACKQFDTLYPPQAYVPLSNVKDCARAASEQAMAVANEIITFWRSTPAKDEGTVR